MKKKCVLFAPLCRIITTDSDVGAVSKIMQTKIQYHDHSVIDRNDNKIFNIAHLADNCGPGCAVFTKDAGLQNMLF